MRGLWAKSRQCVKRKGTTYIVTNFGIFTCSICAALHRELNHKVKGIGMSNFTPEEMNLAQDFGNKVFNAQYMAKHNPVHHPIPTNSDRPKMKAFLESKYTRKLFYSKKRVEEYSDEEEEPKRAPTPPRALPKKKSSKRAKAAAAATAPAYEEKKRMELDTPSQSQPALIVAAGSLLDLTEDEPKTTEITANTFSTPPAWAAFQQVSQASAAAPQPQPAAPPSLFSQPPQPAPAPAPQPAIIPVMAPTQTAPAPAFQQQARRPSLLEMATAPAAPAAAPPSAPATSSTGGMNDLAALLKKAYNTPGSNDHQKMQLLNSIQMGTAQLLQIGNMALSNPDGYFQMQRSLMMQQQQLIGLLGEVGGAPAGLGGGMGMGGGVGGGMGMGGGVGGGMGMGVGGAKNPFDGLL